MARSKSVVWVSTKRIWNRLPLLLLSARKSLYPHFFDRANLSLPTNLDEVQKIRSGLDLTSRNELRNVSGSTRLLFPAIFSCAWQDVCVYPRSPAWPQAQFRNCEQLALPPRPHPESSFSAFSSILPAIVASNRSRTTENSARQNVNWTCKSIRRFAVEEAYGCPAS